MAQSSGIEWTDFTWNPTRGCSRVSEGCRHCYAEQIAARFSGPGKPFEGLAKRVGGEARWTGEVRLVPSLLYWPLKTRKSAEKFRAEHGRRPRVFVNSMSDLFHEKLTKKEIAAVFGVMAAAPWYTFQILTKRPERARQWFGWVVSCPDNLTGGNRYPREVCSGGEIGLGLCRRELDLEVELGARRPWPLPNVWIGCSVEDQETADARIPHLLACPAAVRFVSYEPALGPVNFEGWIYLHPSVAALNGLPDDAPEWTHLGSTRIDQIIVGGESGPNARPFDIGWARSAVRQCREAGVACFVKQLGAKPYADEGCGDCDPCLAGSPRSCSIGGGPTADLKLRDRKGGDMSEWPEDLRIRQFPGEPNAAT